MIRGILFDMDGVLVDSEKYICFAALKMFEEMGVHAAPDDFLPFVGAGENRYIGGVAEKYRIDIDIEIKKKRTYEIYGDLVKGQLDPLPGTISFINRCKEEGFLMAITTSADRIKMETNLREIGLATEKFDTVLTGLDIKRKKPFPDIYLEAAKRLNVDIRDCLVVEDAVNGVQAAKKAGAKCLALTTSFNVDDLFEADWIIHDLSEVSDKLFNEMMQC